MPSFQREELFAFNFTVWCFPWPEYWKVAPLPPAVLACTFGQSAETTLVSTFTHDEPYDTFAAERFSCMPPRSLDEILAEAKASCPQRADVALVEGLAPLARVALTARIARRVQRLLTIKDTTARSVIDIAIRAAEKVAGGESLTQEEGLGFSEEVVLEAVRREEIVGDRITANAMHVANATVRCAYCGEFMFGENVFLAYDSFYSAIRSIARARHEDELHAAEMIDREHKALADDLHTLIMYAESLGEGWQDPHLGKSIKLRDDRGWRLMLQYLGIAAMKYPVSHVKVWHRIHNALKAKGSCFYPKSFFDPL